MTYRELVADILGVELSKHELEGCAGFRCEGEHAETQCSCTSCKVHHIWDKEVDLGKVYANLSTSDAGKSIHKGLLNSMYGKAIIKYYDTDSVEAIREAFKNGSINFCLPMNKPTITLIDNWVEVPSSLIADEVNSIGEILDDATVHGLDFKYENGKFYFKDRQVSPIMDTQDVD